jgi:hypothetical protein
MKLSSSVHVMQSKRQPKVHPLSRGSEDLIRIIALRVLRTQDFIVVFTDGNGYSWKTGLCVINSHSLSYMLLAQACNPDC